MIVTVTVTVTVTNLVYADADLEKIRPLAVPVARGPHLARLPHLPTANPCHAAAPHPPKPPHMPANNKPSHFFTPRLTRIPPSALSGRRAISHRAPPVHTS